MRTLTYEIGGVGFQMTEECAARWNSGTVSDEDLLAIEVIAGEDRWPGGRPSMKTVRENERFADLWKTTAQDCAGSTRGTGADG